MSKSLNNIEDVFFLSKTHEIEQNIPSINPETYINQINNLDNQTFNFIPPHEEINNNSYKELPFLEAFNDFNLSWDPNIFLNESIDEIAKMPNSKNKFIITKNNIFTGRKRKKNEDYSFNEIKGKGKKIHSRNDFDNILTKIQVHYINFIISIANDALKVIYKSNKLKFRNINYQFKSCITYNHFNKLKKGPIKAIFTESISSKYKNCDSHINNIILNKVIEESKWLDNFFNINFVVLFSIYHNNCKPLKKIDFEGKEIILSHRTKPFFNLLKKNKSSKNELIEIVQKAYFDGKKDRKEKTFVTNQDELKD